MMRKLFTWLLVGLLALVPTVAQAQLGSVQYSFSPGSTIRSSEINSLFTYIYANSVLRSGGTLTGTLTTLALLPTTDNASDIGSAALSYNDGWFDGTLTVATLVPTTITCTGCVTSTNVLDDTLVNADINSAAAIVITKLATFTSAELATQLTNESGTGVVAYTISPAFTTPNLGTPSAVTLTNGTGLPWAGVSKSGSSLADLATRAVANLSDGSNVALLDTAQTFTATKKVDTSAMTNAIVIGQHGTATNYGVISFNDTTTWTGMLGIAGKGSGDNTLYAYVPSGGAFDVGINFTQVWKVSASGVAYNGSLTDSYGTPTCGTACSTVAGKDYAFFVTPSSGSDVTVNFGNTWTNPPICVVTAAVAGGSSTEIYNIKTISTTAITVSVVTSGTPDPYNVLCRGY